jgi:hypothetical protein
VPICVEVDGALMEGLIDLLHERADGTLGVLDYKTDQLRTGTAEAHADHYRLQGGAYALAVERATGRKVSTVEFLFPSTDPATVVRYERERVVSLVQEVATLIDHGLRPEISPGSHGGTQESALSPEGRAVHPQPGDGRTTDGTQRE